MVGERKSDQFGEADRSFVLSTLQSPPRNLCHLCEPNDDGGRFKALVSQCDMINEGRSSFLASSTLLIKVVTYRVPVIASPDYWIGRRVQGNSLSWATHVGSQQDYLQLLDLNPDNLRQVRILGAGFMYKFITYRL